MASSPRRILKTALPPALAAAAAIAIPTLFSWSRLPSDVAISWNGAGDPSDAVSKPLFLAVPLCAALLGPLSLRRSRVAVWAFALLLAYGQALCLWASLDQAAGLAARALPGSTSLPVLLLSTAVLVAFWRAPRPDDAFPPRGRHLRPEPPLWTARAQNAYLMAAGTVQLLVQLAAYTDTLPGMTRQPGIIATALLLCFTSTVTVSVDRSGVRFGYGPLGLVRRRRPLRVIARAEAVPIGRPWFLAAGLRGFPGDAVLSLRGGHALVPTYRTGGAFSASVPDAEAGAAAVNGLIAATRRRRDPKVPAA